MGFVCFGQETVEGGEGELVDVVDGVCVRGAAGEGEFGAEVEEDVGELADG